MKITVLLAKRNDFAIYFELYLHNSSSVARMAREKETTNEETRKRIVRGKMKKCTTTKS